MRPLASHRQPLRDGGLGELGLLRLPFPLVLGAAAVPDTTPAGMPVLWALADPKIGEREVLAAMLDAEPELAATRTGLMLITDKGFPATCRDQPGRPRHRTAAPSRKDEQARPGEPLLKPSAS